MTPYNYQETFEQVTVICSPEEEYIDWCLENCPIQTNDELYYLSLEE